MMFKIIRNGSEISADAWNALIAADDQLSEQDTSVCTDPRTGQPITASMPGAVCWKPDGKTICGMLSFRRGKITFETREENSAEEKAREIAEKLDAEVIVYEDA